VIPRIWPYDRIMDGLSWSANQSLRKNDLYIVIYCFMWQKLEARWSRRNLFKNMPWIGWQSWVVSNSPRDSIQLLISGIFGSLSLQSLNGFHRSFPRWNVSNHNGDKEEISSSQGIDVFRNLLSVWENRPFFQDL